MDVRRFGPAFLLILFAAVTSCTARPGGIIIFCAGDSITEGGYPRFLRETLRSEGVKARVLNYGRSGYTSAEYLTFLKTTSTRSGANGPISSSSSSGRMMSGRMETGSHGRSSRRTSARLSVFSGISKPGRVNGLRSSLPPSRQYPMIRRFPSVLESSQRVTAEINPDDQGHLHGDASGFCR